MQKQMDPNVNKCIEECGKCYESCLQTTAYCLRVGGEHVEPAHITLLMDCAEICKISESFMLRDSEHMKCVCEECTEICGECAASCEKIGPKDKQMMECAKMCRECTAACGAMM